MASNEWQEVNIEVEVKQMLTLLANSLYPRPDVAIRELLANAVDALLFRQAQLEREQPGALLPDLAITVSYDHLRRELVVSDSGCGMTKQDIEEHVNKIGSSGTRLREGDVPRHIARNLIGQFGIGLLACFKLGPTVRIRTRAATVPDAPGFEWEARGGEPKARMRIVNDISEPGTTVIVQVDPANQDLLYNKLESLVRHYGDLLPFPIRDPFRRQINSFGKVPWRIGQASDKEALKAYLVERAQPDLMNPPLWVIPVQAMTVDMQGVVYIPNDASFRNMRGAVDLYVHSMLVRKDCEGVLPPSLSFCHGVIDCPELTMIMNREDVERDSRFEEFQKCLRTQVHNGLRELVLQEKDFETVLSCFDLEIKQGILADKDLFGILADHLRFYVGQRERMSLADYCNKVPAPEDHTAKKKIYYISPGGFPQARYQIDQLLRARNLLAIEVRPAVLQLPGGDGMAVSQVNLDQEILARYADEKDLELVPAERLLDELENTRDECWKRVVEIFKAVLQDTGAKVSATEFEPKDLPILLQQPYDPEFESKMKKLQREIEEFEKVRGGEVPDFFRKMIAAALDNVGIGGQPIKVMLNTGNEIMQLYCDIINDDRFRQRDLNDAKARLVALELYHLALQYSGFVATEKTIANVINNRCEMLKQYLAMVSV